MKGDSVHSDPLLVFPYRQLAVISAFLVRDLASFDEALGYPPGPRVLSLMKL